MNNEQRTTNCEKQSRLGFTLIELVIAMSAGMVVVLIVGSLLVSGQRSWARAFNYANSKQQLDALATTITFGTYGRKSNKMDYTLYEIVAGRFQKLPPPANPEEVVTGQAVEFHYWDTELNSTIMNISITGTAYALFYLDDDKLMLDLGPYPPGGVDAVGNRLSAAYVTTVTLAENVTALEFSHTTRSLNGDGKGCVRMSLTVADPNNGSQTTVTAATLMRNVWP
jgi:type II secretory pathway pseudopilin PulG